MSEGWHPISDDGQRMVTKDPAGYAIYSVAGPINPRADVRDFVRRGFVHEFEHAEQWLRDGHVQGAVVTVAVEPTVTKVKSGQPA